MGEGTGHKMEGKVNMEGCSGGKLREDSVRRYSRVLIIVMIIVNQAIITI